MTFHRKKETFYRIFLKVVNLCFWPKNAEFFFINLDLVKIRLEIMLSAFAEKKETCFDFKKQIFLSPKNALFQRGQPMLLVKKCHFFLYLDLVKIRLEIMLNHFEERKETF